MARRTLLIVLSLLAVVLLGVLGVLSTISFYLAIDPPAFIREEELRPINASHTINPEQLIPKIIHQTWKTDQLPERWRIVSQGCKDLMPDYEYKLWTDESSRMFIEDNYPWFLDTFDGYKYPIQRADAIRYFVLHHYGGVYMDLDVGCIRRMDPLLQFQVILPITIPVGVSNDLMFSTKGHPFMEQTIRHLITFDHSWILNYPTVMFSTGPMFVSAQYGIYTAAHPPTAENPGGDVRILPKSLYGKNAKVEEAPNSFFSHHYGSSWHADDAALITFLGRSGMNLMWLGFIVLAIGMLRVCFQTHRSGRGRSLRRRLASARVDLLLPRRISSRGGNITLDIITPASNGSASTTTNTSPTSTEPSSPTSRVPLLPYNLVDSSQSLAAGAIRRAGAWACAKPPTESNGRPSHSRHGWGSGSGTLFFLPAIFTPTTGASSHTRAGASRSTSARRNSKARSPIEDIEVGHGPTASSSTAPPPPYVEGTSDSRDPNGRRTGSTSGVNRWFNMSSDEEWTDWSQPRSSSSSSNSLSGPEH